MNINVTIDEITLTTVVAEASEYGPGSTIGDLVAAQIVQRLTSDRDWYERTREVAEIKREVIREAVRPAIEQAVAEPIQKTSVYGDPIGEPVTLREVIVDEARKLVNKSTDQYSRSGQTVLQKLVADEVKEAFSAEIRDAVQQARASVADEIGKQVASAVAAAMKGR